MEPIVSILIPAYNAQGTIGDTIRSALQQSWSRKEIVVVDDGSTDETLNVARSFASSDVLVVHQSNQGAAAARNKALTACRGDYIQWLDADDLLSVDKVSRQMSVIARDCRPLTLAASEWGRFRYRPWKTKFISNPLWQDLEPVEWMVRKWETNSYMQTAAWLVSRQLTEDAGPWDTRLLGDDDGEYFARVIVRSEAVRFVPGARVFYRISPETRLSYIGASNAKIDAQFLGMQLQIGYLRSLRDDERTRAACTRYLETWMCHFYANRPDIVERARLLARSWGAELRMPRLGWKYDWIRRCFGWPAARRVQLHYNQSKSRAISLYDRVCFMAQGGGRGPSRL